MMPDYASLPYRIFVAYLVINSENFLGVVSFDSVKLYKELLPDDTFGTDANDNGIYLQKTYIPLVSQADLENTDYSKNLDCIPCLIKNAPIPMKHEGASKLRNNVIQYNFSCP